MKYKLVLSLLAAAFCASAAFAQIDGASSDSRVRAALREADLNFQVDSDGDFRLVFDLDDDRTQLVWVNSNTETYGNMEIREIWSYGYRVSDGGPLTRDQLEDLLKRNNSYKMGSWRLSSSGQNVIFTVTVSANANADTLDDVCRIVARTADALEAEWLESDDL